MNLEYCPTFKLTGKIIQTFDGPIDAPRLQFIDSRSDITTYGDFGASCWWIPLFSYQGIKIYNHTQYKTLEAVKFQLAKKLSRMDKLYKYEKLRQYLPKFISPAIVEFHGQYTFRGVRKHETVTTKNSIFFPAVILLTYKVKWELIISSEQKLELQNTFAYHGFPLHSDSFAGRQIGVTDDNKIVLLDIEIFSRGKLL